MCIANPAILHESYRIKTQVFEIYEKYHSRITGWFFLRAHAMRKIKNTKNKEQKNNIFLALVRGLYNPIILL